jgi:hypothetical protein
MYVVHSPLISLSSFCEFEISKNTFSEEREVKRNENPLLNSSLSTANVSKNESHVENSEYSTQTNPEKTKSSIRSIQSENDKTIDTTLTLSKYLFALSQNEKKISKID